MVLDDEHRIAITVETILRVDSLTIRGEHALATGKRTYKHEEGGSRQVEVREKSIDDVKRVSGMHEQIGRPRARTNVALRTRGLQRAHRRRADGYDTLSLLLRVGNA